MEYIIEFFCIYFLGVITCWIIFVTSKKWKVSYLQGYKRACVDAADHAKGVGDFNVFEAAKGELNIGIARANVAHELELTYRSRAGKIKILDLEVSND